jgi:probable HAF family extracellular repeat protein
MKTILKATLAAGLLTLSLSGQSQTTYLVTDLGPVGNQPGQPFAVNHQSVVAGVVVSPDKLAHASVSYKGWQFDLSKPGLGGSNSLAHSVNETGQVVGQAETATLDPHNEDFCGYKALGLATQGNTCVPFLWQDGVMTQLTTLGGNNGSAWFINNRSQVVGWAETTQPDPNCPFPLVSQFKPVLWTIGSVQALPLAKGDADGIALAINDHGQAVGASGTCTTFNLISGNQLQALHALLWQNGAATDLGNLGGTGHLLGNIALDINNQGQVVGNSDVTGDRGSHAFLWTSQKGMQDLGTLPGDAISTAIWINDAGTIVGVSADAHFNPRGVIWQNGVMTDLNTLVPKTSPLFLLTACSVNATGEIIGLAVDKATGEAHGYLATPKPATSEFSTNEASGDRPVLSEAVRQLVRQRGYGTMKSH